MSIFYDDDGWDKAKIVKIFGSKNTLKNVSIQTWHSSNGEYKFGGYWFHYTDMQELIRIYDESKDDVKDSNIIVCWSCSEWLTEIARSENDGFCPFCQVEIELD